MNLVQLIESVKKQSNIYKNLHEDDEEYLREWQRVAEECHITLDEAQDQWNMLLLEYMEYLRGNHDFTMSKYMDFIQPHLFTIIEDDIIDEDELLNILSEGRVQFDSDGPMMSPKKCPKDDISSPTNSHQPDDIPSLPLDFIHIKKEKISTLKTNEPTTPATSAPAQSLSPTPTTAAPPVPEAHSLKESSFSNLSSMDLIFLGYAKQLQKMPLPLQQQIKRKIAEVMDEAELKMMHQM